MHILRNSTNSHMKFLSAVALLQTHLQENCLNFRIVGHPQSSMKWRSAATSEKQQQPTHDLLPTIRWLPLRKGFPVLLELPLELWGPGSLLKWWWKHLMYPLFPSLIVFLSVVPLSSPVCPLHRQKTLGWLNSEIWRARPCGEACDGSSQVENPSHHVGMWDSHNCLAS